MTKLRIDELLKEKNKTKYWLTKKLETDYRYVDNLVKNKTSSIKFSTIDKLCELFECTVCDLFKQD